MLPRNHHSTSADSPDDHADEEDPDINGPGAALKDAEKAALRPVQNCSRPDRDDLFGAFLATWAGRAKNDALGANRASATATRQLGGCLRMFVAVKLSDWLRSVFRIELFSAPHAEEGTDRVVETTFGAVHRVNSSMFRTRPRGGDRALSKILGSLPIRTG